MSKCCHPYKARIGGNVIITIELQPANLQTRNKCGTVAPLHTQSTRYFGFFREGKRSYKPMIILVLTKNGLPMSLIVSDFSFIDNVHCERLTSLCHATSTFYYSASIINTTPILFVYAFCGTVQGGIPIDRGSDVPIIEKGPLDRGSDRPIIEKGPLDQGSDSPIIQKGPLDRGSDRPILPRSIGSFSRKGSYIDRGSDRPIIDMGPIDRGSYRPMSDRSNFYASNAIIIGLSDPRSKGPSVYRAVTLYNTFKNETRINLMI